MVFAASVMMMMKKWGGLQCGLLEDPKWTQEKTSIVRTMVSAKHQAVATHNYVTEGAIKRWEGV